MSANGILLVRTRAAQIGVALAGIALLYLSVTYSLAIAISNANPGLAMTLGGNLSRALEQRADQVLTSQIRNPRGRQEAAELARAAIRRDGTSARAYRLLAMMDDLGNRPRQATALLAYSERLTRRDAALQLLLIERAVTRNDVPGALAHYDVALRTSSRSFDVLAPVLASAIGDRELTPALVGLFRTDPPWLPGFLEYAIPNTPAPVRLAGIMVQLRSNPEISRRGSIMAMVERLIRDERYAAARLFLTAMAPAQAGNGALVANGRFNLPDGYPPFDWGYVASVNLGAERNPGGGLDLYAQPEQSGTVVRQLLTLPAGRFQLSSALSGRAQDSFSRTKWVLRCTTAESPLVNLDLPIREQAQRRNASFVVPDRGCEAQWFELQIVSGDEPGGLEAHVPFVAIEAR